MAQEIQVVYDDLDHIIARFGDMADTARDCLSKVTAQVEELRGGEWIGPNADSFYGDYDDAMEPVLTRLAAALDQAADIVGQISAEFADAEEEAEGLFPN